MKASKSVISIFIVVLLMLSTGTIFAGDNGTDSNTYTNPSYKYDSPSGSTTAKETIVLNGLHSDSSLIAEDSIHFSAKLTTSGTLNKTYCFSIEVESFADNCTVSSISADFDGTGLPSANANNVSLNHNDDESWSCILNGNTSGGYVSSFKIVVQHTCEYSEITEPSTCSDTGYIADCCSCGHKEIRSTLDLLDHTYGEWKTISEPTATNNGLKQRVCSTCGFVDEAEIPRLEDVIDSGTNADVSWYINSAYKLVINGTASNLCGYDGPWYSYKDQVKSLVVSGDIRLVYGFGSYSVLESVDILDNVKEIAEFNGCTNLKSVTLPSEFWVINNETFADCTSLEEIIFPETVNYIGSGAFYGCTSLEEVVLPKMVVDYMGSNAYRGAFQGCTSLSRVVLPNNLEYIPEGCFRLCTSLSSIEIPESVERINNGAFADCSNLTDVYFKGASPNTIGNDTFSGTSNNLVIHYDPDTRGWQDNDIWDGYTLEPFESSDVGDLKYNYVNVKLSQSCYNRDGDYVDPPSVIVTNYKGKPLIEGADYEVAYDAAPYTQGTHEIRVKGIDPFIFDKTVSYSVLAGNVLEWNSTAPYGSVYFSKSDDEQTLFIFGSGDMRDVVATSSYGAYALPGYCYNANGKVYMKGVTTVVIDEGVTSIGRASFASYYASDGSSGWFPDLKTVIVPSTVTAIKASGICPFSDSEPLESVYIYSKNAELQDDSIHAKVIYGYPNSTAQSYASKNNIAFHPICEYHNIVTVNKIDPTCTTEGYSGDYKCSECGTFMQYGEEIEALGHDYQEMDGTAIEPTCTEDGKAANKKCSRCDDTVEGEVIPARHDLITHPSTTSTCSSQGSIEYFECRSCSKLFVKGDTDESLTEVSLDDTLLPLEPHEWGSWNIVTYPTCVKKGLRVRFCNNCEAEERTDIDLIDHEWEESYTIDKSATCTENGSQSIHCSRCGGSSDAETIPALGHAWNTETTVDKAVTCTSDGSESIHCSRCGEIEEGTTHIIPATGHSYSAWATTIAATEANAGQRSHRCSTCGKTETQTIAQLAPSLPSVKISKPKAAKKKITVKWKKVSKKNQKKIQGIEIQVATDPNFTNIVKATTARKNKTSKAIKGLTSKTIYYVRVRAYNNSGGLHRSAWSIVKPVKVK